MKKIIAIILSTVVLSNLAAGVGFAYEPANATRVSQSSDTQDQGSKKKSMDLIAKEIRKVSISEKEKYLEFLTNEIQKVEKMSDNEYKCNKFKKKLKEITTMLLVCGLVLFGVVYTAYSVGYANGKIDEYMISVKT